MLSGHDGDDHGDHGHDGDEHTGRNHNGDDHGVNEWGGEWHALPTLDTDNPGVQQTLSAAAAPTPQAGAFPLGDTFNLSSSPTSTKTIYLDFDGETTQDSWWNGGAAFTTPAYSTDSDTANFSNQELMNIQEMFLRVAEDFSPFDVNVTTAEPPAGDLIKSGGTDDRWGIRVVIGGNGSWFGSAGGVAYLESFNANVDRHCFVFSDNTGGGFPRYTADAITHEVGHSLNLNHDGEIPGDGEYYSGHGPGGGINTYEWGPIMGPGYYARTVQFSIGDYENSTNTEDDLQIITTQNGFGYVADDYADDIAGALDLPATTVPGGGRSVDVSGVISETGDKDFFRLDIQAGTIDLAFDGAQYGSNLDIGVELFDANGSLVLSVDPQNIADATLNLTVPPGTYYLAVDGVGKQATGTGELQGYSDYGSLGQYTITGTIPAAPASNADPVLSADPLVTYAFGNAPVAVYQNATLTDADSADFDGGSLEVLLEDTGYFEGIYVRAGFGVTIDGSTNVLVNGVNIGTFDGQDSTNVAGTDYDRLTYNFNANATPARILTLLESLHFNSVENAPTVGVRDVITIITDGDGGSDTFDSEIDFVSNNQPPVISSGAGVTYEIGGPSVQAVGGLSITDSDSPNMFGGELKILFEQVDAGEGVSLVPNASVTIDGSNIVSVGVQDIGTFVGTTTETRGGTDYTVLTYDLNDGANAARLVEVVNAHRFDTVEATPTLGDRELIIEIDDGDGGGIASNSSVVSVVQQAVNQDPVLDGDPSSTFTIGTTNPPPLVGNFSLTDDTPAFDGGTLRLMMESIGYAEGFALRPGAGAGVSGGLMYVNGVVIGTYDGYTFEQTAAGNYNTINFTLNANATTARIEQFVSAHTYGTNEPVPTNGTREIRVEVSDGEGGSDQLVTELVIVNPAASSAPNISSDASVTFEENGPGVPIIENLVVTDADTLGFGGGRLVIMLEDIPGQSENFFIRPGSGVTMTGGDLFVDGVNVGFANFGGISYRDGIAYHSMGIRLYADATAARVQKLVSGFDFFSDDPNPVYGPREFRLELTDGTGALAEHSSTVNVIPESFGPDIDSDPGVVFYEGDDPIDIVANLSIGDANYTGGSLRIMLEDLSFFDDIFFEDYSTANYDWATQQISVGGTVIGTFLGNSYDAIGGTTFRTWDFTLNAAATGSLLTTFVEAYAFWNTNPNPVVGLRDLVLELTDASGNVTQNFSTIEVIAENTPTDIQIGGTTPLQLIEQDPPVQLLGGVLVTDADTPDFEDSVIVVEFADPADAQLGDVFGFDAGGPFLVNGNALVENGVVIGLVDQADGYLRIELTESTFAPKLESILENISFFSISDFPPETPRTAVVSLDVPDVPDTVTVSRDIEITGVDDDSVLILPQDPVQFVEDDGPVAFAGDVTLFDPDTPSYDGAQILARTVAGRQPGERYTLDTSGPVDVVGVDVLVNGIIVGTQTSQGSLLVINLGPDATRDDTEILIEAILYESVNDNPAVSKVGQVWLTDPNGLRTIVNRDIAVTPVNDPPGLANIRGSLTFFEDGGPRLLSSQAHVADPDWTGGGSISLSWTDFGANDELILLDLGTITSSGDLDALATGDELFHNGTKLADVTVTDNGATGVITFDLVAVTNRFEVREIFRAAAFNNPSDGPEVQDRFVTFGFTDDLGASASATTTVRMQTYNDPAVVTVNTPTGSVDIAAGLTTVDAAVAVTDGDGPGFGNGRVIVQVAGGRQSGDRLRLLREGSTTVTYSTTETVTSGGAAVGRVTETGAQVRIEFFVSATTAQVDEVLSRVVYENTSGLPQTGQRTIRFTAFDAGNEGGFDEFLLDVQQGPASAPAVDLAAALLLDDDWLDG